MDANQQIAAELRAWGTAAASFLRSARVRHRLLLCWVVVSLVWCIGQASVFHGPAMLVAIIGSLVYMISLTMRCATGTNVDDGVTLVELLRISLIGFACLLGSLLGGVGLGPLWEPALVSDGGVFRQVAWIVVGIPLGTALITLMGATWVIGSGSSNIASLRTALKHFLHNPLAWWLRGCTALGAMLLGIYLTNRLPQPNTWIAYPITACYVTVFAWIPLVWAVVVRGGMARDGGLME